MANIALKKSIAVMAKFTNKYHSGYGKTPGRFIVKYISRNDATENLTPISDSVHQSLQHYQNRYLYRDEVIDNAIQQYDSKDQLKNQLASNDALNGCSFGDLGLSYSKDQLLQQADDVQSLYQHGHTIEKLVISFTSEYARQLGVLPNNYQHLFRGDFRGQVDQLKLRTAINHGMKEMALRSNYTDPIWMGSIQVDTNHLHAHMVLGDRIELNKSKRMGIFYGHSEERGKLTSYERDGCREMIHASLLSHHTMHHFHTQTDLDTQTEHSNVQDLVQFQFGDNTQIQLILASLPRNRDLWDANSDEPVMKRPNKLMDKYLNSLVHRYDSQLGYTDTLSQLKAQSRVQARQYDGSLNYSDTFYQHNVKSFRAKLKNQIYQQLNDLLDDQPKMLSTDFIAQNARDPEALKFQIRRAFEQPTTTSNLNMTLFTYRLTSYRQRLDEHKQKSQAFHKLQHQFDQQAINGPINQSALSMRRYYRNESYYHDLAIDKYRYFFKIDGHDDEKIVHHFNQQLPALQAQRSQIIQQGQRDGLWSFDAASGQSWQSFRQTKGQEILHDARLGDMLRQPLSHPQGQITSLGLSVMKAMQDPYYTLPDETATRLDEAGQIFSEYELVGSDLRPATKKRNSVPSYALSTLMARYAMDLDNVSTQMFEQGVIPAVFQVDGFQTIQKFEDHPDLQFVPEIPVPKIRDQFLTKHYFNHVRGVDLDDLGFDFGPNTNRHVSPSVAKQYQQITKMRYTGVQKAVRFLSETQQTQAINAFRPLFSQLQNNAQLSHYVSANHVLPLGILRDEDTSFDDQRQFKSINLQEANQVTRNQLSLIRDLTHQTQISAQQAQQIASSQPTNPAAKSTGQLPS